MSAKIKLVFSRCNFLNTEARRTRRTILLLLCALCDSVFQNSFRGRLNQEIVASADPTPTRRLILTRSRCNFLNTEARRTRRTILLLLYALCDSVFQNYFRGRLNQEIVASADPTPTRRLILTRSRCNFLNTEARRTRRTILLLLCALCDSVFQNYFRGRLNQEIVASADPTPTRRLILTRSRCTF